MWFSRLVYCAGFQPAVLPAVQDPVQRTQPPDQLGPGPAAAEAGLQQVLHPVRGHPGQVRAPGPSSMKQLTLGFDFKGFSAGT